MAIRVTLECGHISMLRTQVTPQGYTHDWEVFVRGVDNANIHHYVEKVVFNLHETFPQPKRVIKEPPFVIKESGYAGFPLPIHVYLKNKVEPKKFTINYDLFLQPSGPPFTNSIRHTEIINNPTDEFRRKLLKGGAVVSSSENLGDKNESKTPNMIGKPKLSGSETKKHKAAENKTSDSFAELFGTPLKPTKVSQENKKPSSQPNKSSTPKPPVPPEKSDKVDKQAKAKHCPYKDGKKDKVDEKKDKKVKDSSKDKDRSKDKSKRPSSPSSKSHLSPSAKRPLSPLSVKRPPSPSVPPAKRPSSPKLVKEKEPKKSVPEKEREKEKEKSKESSKSSLDTSKGEKRKEKKHKEDRDKERKEKYKEGDRSSLKEALKPPAEKKSEKSSEKPEKADKPEKNQEYKSTKEERKSPKPPKETEKPKEEKPAKIEKSEKPEKSDKPKDGKTEKDRQKHKHKKRDKKDKRDSSRERERKEKHERIKVSAEKQSNVPAVPASNPLSTLLAEMRDSSDSPPSIDDDSFSEPKLASGGVKKELDPSPPPVVTLPPEGEKPLALPGGLPPDTKKEKTERSKRDKGKGSRGEEKESRKRKRRSDSKGDDEHAPVKKEKDRGHSSSPPLEPVSSSQSPVAVEQKAPIHAIKEDEERNMLEQAAEKDEADAEQVAPDSTNSTLVESDVGEPPVFSEDYVSQLKDLQQKIMTLQDNQELQRVVQVIAETGQYEITKKTFDFDLCALDRRTVARLQQFFSAS